MFSNSYFLMIDFNFHLEISITPKKSGPSKQNGPLCHMVPMAGVEPARLTPLPPQDSVSTNSTTSAKTKRKKTI